MTIKEFAEKYRVKRLPGGSPSKYLKNHVPVSTGDVVEGKAGFIDEAPNKCPSTQENPSKNGLLELQFVGSSKTRQPETPCLPAVSKAAQAAGMTLKARSGAESEWYFYYTVSKQVGQSCPTFFGCGSTVIEWR